MTMPERAVPENYEKLRIQQGRIPRRDGRFAGYGEAFCLVRGVPMDGGQDTVLRNAYDAQFTDGSDTSSDRQSFGERKQD